MNKEKLSKIKEISFECIDCIDFPIHEKSSYRVSEIDLLDMPADYEEQQSILREKIIELFEEKLDSKKTQVYEVCDIDRTNFGRFLSGKYGITKTNLVKFIIGLKLDMNTARELLSLNGTPLEPHVCRFDYIASLAIDDGDELDDFMDELVKFGCKNIATK